ncbi:MAG: small basic protein [Lentisphaerae bacterium]|nr:small basic protein [Lentisphaerota bacterium]
MSQHSSLKGSSKIKVRRNVLKRFERIDLMLKRGIITKENVPASGLPKTKPDE